MFTGIATRYDLANHALSGGLDWWWRRQAAKVVRRWSPRDVLDLATGSGDLALTIQAACPAATVVGADFCEAMLVQARRKGLSPAVLADALDLPFANGTFDVVTVAFGLRNMSSWSRALEEMARVLRPRGHCLILDFSLPAQPLRWLYRPYLHVVLPRVAGWLTGKPDAYTYLGASIEQFPSGPAMCALLAEAGFAEPAFRRLSGGIVTLYTASRPSLGASPAAC